ncbi:MAG: hypothetical protein [Caudoviricetes sp.]|nr:MAG: hypothetical protein [Caudoviricetes sp.]
MNINEVIARLEEIKQYQGGELEVKVYFQNTQYARDFDCIGLTKDKGAYVVWLSDLGE